MPWLLSDGTDLSENLNCGESKFRQHTAITGFDRLCRVPLQACGRENLEGHRYYATAPIEVHSAAGVSWRGACALYYVMAPIHQTRGSVLGRQHCEYVASLGSAGFLMLIPICRSAGKITNGWHRSATMPWHGNRRWLNCVTTIKWHRTHLYALHD